MIDVTLAEGALVLASGVLTGWVARGRSERRRRDVDVTPQFATCACGHARSKHVDGKGACTEVEVDYRWIGPAGDQEKVRQEYSCACKVYDGPEPLPTYYHPEIGS